MCRDCPTKRDTLRGVVHELVADLVMFLFVLLLPVGLLMVTGQFPSA